MKNVLTAVLAVSLAACGTLEAEAESKRLCVEQTDAAVIPAAPPVNVPFTPPVELVLGMGAAVPDLDEEGIEVDIAPEAITLGSTAGNVDFSGVQTLVLTVRAPSSRPDLTDAVFQYERATNAPSPTFALPATPLAPVDLADYIAGNVLRIAVSFEGSAPQQSWSATLEMCGATRVKVDYWERITG